MLLGTFRSENEKNYMEEKHRATKNDCERRKKGGNCYLAELTREGGTQIELEKKISAQLAGQASDALQSHRRAQINRDTQLAHTVLS